MTTRPTPRDVIARVHQVFNHPTASWPTTADLNAADAILAALDQAGVRTYHEADARHGWLAITTSGPRVYWREPIHRPNAAPITLLDRVIPAKAG